MTDETVKMQLSKRGAKPFSMSSVRDFLGWVFEPTSVEGYDQMEEEGQEAALREWRHTIIQRNEEKFATVEANKILGALGTHVEKVS
jgi:hypothetical protein